MSEDERKLFVAGLSETITEGELREAFAAAGGAIADMSVPRDRATGAARGFAFVTLESAGQAAAVLAALDGSQLGGKSLSVRPFKGERSSPAARGERAGGPSLRPPLARPPTEDSTLYVGNLPFDVSVEDLTALFQQAGFDSVRRVHLPTDPEGRKRGFGFVTLGDAESARLAGEKMQGQMLQGRALSVNLARRAGTAPAAGPPPARTSGRPSRGPEDPRASVPPSLSVRPPSEFGEAPEERRSSARREKKKDKKRKGRGLGPEKSHSRRANEGFKAPRHRGTLDDWEE